MGRSPCYWWGLYSFRGVVAATSTHCLQTCVMVHEPRKDVSSIHPLASEMAANLVIWFENYQGVAWCADPWQPGIIISLKVRYRIPPHVSSCSGLRVSLLPTALPSKISFDFARTKIRERVRSWVMQAQGIHLPRAPCIPGSPRTCATTPPSAYSACSSG